MSEANQAETPASELSPEAYYERWMAQMRALEKVDRSLFSRVLVFRIRDQWLALRASFIKEVTTLQKVHRIPHRSDDLIRGLVNVRGELQIRVSLRTLLGIQGRDNGSAKTLSRKAYRRLVVIEQERQSFSFFAEEVFGMTSIENDKIESVPKKTSSVIDRYVKHTFNYKGCEVSWLDDELIFYRLRKALQ